MGKFKVGDMVVGKDNWRYLHEGKNPVTNQKYIGVIENTRSGDVDPYYSNIVRWLDGGYGRSSNAGDMCLDLAPIVVENGKIMFRNVVPLGGKKYVLRGITVIVFGNL